MVIKARQPKRPPPAAEPPLQWERADPAALASFDSSTKTCTMNCGPHGLDPRSREERLFLCDDCDCHAAPSQKKGTPAMPTEFIDQSFRGVPFQVARIDELTAKRIHDFRVAQNWTREQAAAQVGVTAGRWYLWETGSAVPVKAAAEALAALIEAAEAAKGE